MFDSKLAKKFLEKIHTMTFEELDERARLATGCGIEQLIHDAECLTQEQINLIKSRIRVTENYLDILRQEFEQLPYVASRLYSSTFVDL